MAVSTLLVRSYASNIYMTGRNSFENIEATRPEYVTPDGGPVMAYAAHDYYIDDINRALNMTWITPQQHADTLALKGPTDKQYRPIMMAVSEGSA